MSTPNWHIYIEDFLNLLKVGSGGTFIVGYTGRGRAKEYLYAIIFCVVSSKLKFQ